jgi:hypothetical protein
MIDKQEFYHGAAITRLLEDPRCERVRPHDFGYVVNEAVFVFLKYSTKGRSPWGFVFSSEEAQRLDGIPTRVFTGLICGGDGICAVAWEDVKALLGATAGSGRIAVRRRFNEQYGVSGPAAELKGKVPVKAWPSLVLDPYSSESAPRQIREYE